MSDSSVGIAAPFQVQHPGHYFIHRGSSFPLFLIVLTLFCTTPLLAQQPPPLGVGFGEVIFLRSTDLGQAFYVRLQLDGPIFNEQGYYRDQVRLNEPGWNPPSHPDTMYREKRSLIGNYLGAPSPEGDSIPPTGKPSILCWESVWEDDVPAGQIDDEFCPGMIGFGLYKVTVTLDVNSSSISFYINTLDGNWGDIASRTYDWVFTVDDVLRGGLVVPKVTFSTQDPNNPTIEVAPGQVVTWEDICQLPRERTTIKHPSINRNFTIHDQAEYPLVVTNAVLDVNTVVEANPTIPVGKSLTIQDYNSGSTTLLCKPEVSFIVRGLLSGIASNLEGVVFTSNSIPSNYWNGIEVEGPSLVPQLDFTRVKLEQARIGIDAKYSAYLQLNESFIHWCKVGDKYGIRLDNSKLIMNSCNVAFNGDGILARGDCQGSVINKSRIYSNRGFGLHLVNVTSPDYSPGGSFLVDTSMVDHNRRHGIFVQSGSAVKIRKSIISDNGNNLPYFINDGIWNEGSALVLNQSTIESNSAYGLHQNDGGVSSGYDYFTYDGQVTNPENRGLNCFDTNKCSIGANNTISSFVTEIWMGLPRDPQVDLYPGGKNSFKRPFLPSPAGDRINVTADHGTVVHVRNDFWTHYNWIMQNGAVIYPEDPIWDPITDGAPCPVINPPPPSGGQLPPLLSGVALDLVNARLYRNWNTTYSLSSQILQSNPTLTDATIAACGLSLAGIYGGIPEARQILELFALNPKNPGEAMCNNELASLVYLRHLLLTKGDLSAFMIANDTLEARFSETMDGISALLTKATVLHHLLNNTDAALEIIRPLFIQMPDSVSISNIYWSIAREDSIISIPKRRPSSNEVIAKQIFLDQNYPNPFNPSTTISFSIPVAGYVRLFVFDYLGRIETILINGFLEKGAYLVPFRPKNQSSGIYLFRLVYHDLIFERKMCFIK